MIGSALAGHAGEAGGSHLLPPEITGILAVMTVLLGAILLVGLVGLWLLLRIHHRLRTDRKESLSKKAPSS